MKVSKLATPENIPSEIYPSHNTKYFQNCFLYHWFPCSPSLSHPVIAEVLHKGNQELGQRTKKSCNLLLHQHMFDYFSCQSMKFWFHHGYTDTRSAMNNLPKISGLSFKVAACFTVLKVSNTCFNAKVYHYFILPKSKVLSAPKFMFIYI